MSGFRIDKEATDPAACPHLFHIQFSGSPMMCAGCNTPTDEIGRCDYVVGGHDGTRCVKAAGHGGRCRT